MKFSDLTLAWTTKMVNKFQPYLPTIFGEHFFTKDELMLKCPKIGGLGQFSNILSRT